jgi:hypothetical protein
MIMHIYRFRVVLEDQDDFFRDIEIRSNQTFEDLHHIILQTVEIEPKELASFYTCDSKWKKKTEITLVEMEKPAAGIADEEVPKQILMCDSRLCDFIDDPHQRIVYIYDYLNYWTFYIELLKIIPAEPKIIYPRCTKKLGVMPKQHSTVTAFIPNEFAEEFSSENDQLVADEFEVEDENIDLLSTPGTDLGLEGDITPDAIEEE